MRDNNNDNPITKEIVGIKNEREILLIKVWWNAAIEKAAKVAMENGEGCCYDIGEAIRNLKVK